MSKPDDKMVRFTIWNKRRDFTSSKGGLRMGKSKPMVETKFRDENMTNGFCHVIATDLCFPRECQNASKKSIKQENEDLQASRIAINFCNFPEMWSCRPAPEFSEFRIAG
jgi:hypothetical protein